MANRFCTTCQSEQPEEGGYKKPGHCRGWRCKSCMERRSVSIYATQGKTTAKNILRLKAAMKASGRVL